MKQLSDYAANVANGGIENPFIKTIKSISNPLIILGSIMKKLFSIGDAAITTALINEAFNFADNLSQNHKIEYYQLYRGTAARMENNNYIKVRLKGYFTPQTIIIDGIAVNYFIINGFPSVTGFQLSNGQWMYAE